MASSSRLPSCTCTLKSAFVCSWRCSWSLHSPCILLSVSCRRASSVSSIFTSASRSNCLSISAPSLSLACDNSSLNPSSLAQTAIASLRRRSAISSASAWACSASTTLPFNTPTSSCKAAIARSRCLPSFSFSSISTRCFHATSANSPFKMPCFPFAASCACHRFVPALHTSSAIDIADSKS